MIIGMETETESRCREPWLTEYGYIEYWIDRSTTQNHQTNYLLDTGTRK